MTYLGDRWPTPRGRCAAAGWRRLTSTLAAAALLGATAVACGSSSTPRADDPAGTTQPQPASEGTTTLPDTRATPPLHVTTTVVTFTDPTRGTVARPPVPASDTRVLATTVRVPDGPGPWPLVVFGHGFDASPDTYASLLDAIAGAGFVVAAPDFPGSSSARPGRPDERDLQDEPCDLRLVADQVQAASDGAGALHGRVLPGPVALAGQSDGATAAAFAALDSTCDGPPVAAVVAFSARPAPLRPGLDPAALPALLAVTGSADTVNPPERTHALFAEFTHEAWYLTSDGDGHLASSTDSPHRTAITAATIDLLQGALDRDPAALARIAVDTDVAGLSLESRP